MPEETEPPRDVTIRVARDTGYLITTVAHSRGLSVAEYIEQTLRPIVLEEYREHLEAERVKVRREIAAAK